MKRVRTRIGDVFCARLDEHTKKYFQYVANDLTQLNSDVIRAFRKAYPLHETPDLSEIVADEVDLYAHVVVPLGIKMNLWEKVGHAPNVGDLDVVFKDTEDYGTKLGEEPVKVSTNWHIWRLNEDFQFVGKLEGEYTKAFIGLVFNPYGLLELLRGKKYPPFYPDW